MNVSVKYGKEEVSFDINGAKSVEYLYENEMPVIDDLPAEFERAVGSGAYGKPLCERVGAGDKITIIISDQTRFWMRQDMILELLVKYLERCGIAYEDMVVVVALGTHRKQTDAELKMLASEYVYDRVKVVNHDCDADDLVYVGTTDRGTQVYVNPLVAGRKVICIGGTVHHLMAGYGGGRKSIVPGVASRMTIKQNHSMALDKFQPHTDEKVGSGKLFANPINEDMVQAGRFVSPVFGINIVVNNHSKHSGLFCGDFDRAWMASCEFVQKCYGKPIAYEADVVIASCNGYPKDINLYQAVKSLLNGTRALKKGGTFLFFAECCEGGGAPDFFDWIKPLGEGRLDAALREAFTIAGYIFYASCESIAKSGKFLMLSKFEPETVAGMGIRSFKNVDEMLSNVDFEGKSVYVIPNGGSLLPQVDEDYKKLCDEFK